MNFYTFEDADGGQISIKKDNISLIRRKNNGVVEIYLKACSPTYFSCKIPSEESFKKFLEEVNE